MHQVVGYRYVSTIHEDAATVVTRAVREVDGRGVLIKAQKARVPAPTQLALFRKERDILGRMDSDRVVTCLGITEQETRLAIILEDFGGESLDRVVASRPLTLFEVLEIAVQAVQALGDIHGAGVIHRDINPSNLIWHSETGELKIANFWAATASWLPLQADARTLQDNLAYMSPEQTGRLNRAVDHRSDFYSLGATLYALLVNRPPFTATDTLELVHAHIARMPTPPHERDPSIPLAVSSIVMKLLSKAPEERYQSVRGIQEDLGYCLNQLRVGHRLSGGFVPGRYDVPETFRISGKLYGRTLERGVISDASSRAARGRTDLVLISGSSGVGKSALAFELGHQITGVGGNFITGKFDQIKTSAPYGAIAAAFQQLVGNLLSAGQDVLEHYRSRLLQTLHNNARVIIDIVPQIELIIGAQASVARSDTKPFPPCVQAVHWGGCLGRASAGAVPGRLAMGRWRDYGARHGARHRHRRRALADSRGVPNRRHKFRAPYDASARPHEGGGDERPGVGAFAVDPRGCRRPLGRQLSVYSQRRPSACECAHA